MSANKLQLSFLDEPEITASDIEVGGVFQIGTGKSAKTMLRVKPTGFLLNSTLVGDVINNHGVFSVDLIKGTLYPVTGNTPVIPVAARVTVSRTL